MSTAAKHADIRDMSFERAIKELETTVGRLDRGDVELEESISDSDRLDEALPTPTDTGRLGPLGDRLARKPIDVQHLEPVLAHFGLTPNREVRLLVEGPSYLAVVPANLTVRTGNEPEERGGWDPRKGQAGGGR